MSKSSLTLIHKNRSNVLTIAGSDSGGGAGIQADIKAISATGSYACSVITALTAQNTLGVHAIHPVPADFVQEQLEAVFSDIRIDAVKIGMLNRPDVINVIAQMITKYQPKHVVLDPVMVATSGARLIEQDAIEELKIQLFPLVTLITPNLPEATLLFGYKDYHEGSDDFAVDDLLAHIQTQNHQVDILLKGGHMSTENSEDWLITQKGIQTFTERRVVTENSHGTGCSLSSAIASYLAQGLSLNQAISKAKRYLTIGLKESNNLTVGHGAGPIDHFHQWTGL